MLDVLSIPRAVNRMNPEMVSLRPAAMKSGVMISSSIREVENAPGVDLVKLKLTGVRVAPPVKLASTSNPTNEPLPSPTTPVIDGNLA